MTATLPSLDPAGPDSSGLHPAWCLPGLCERAGPVVRHSSAPIVWRMVGEDVDVLMRRRQEGLAGDVLIEMSFSNWACAGEEITLTFAERDVDQLVTGVSELRECI